MRSRSSEIRKGIVVSRLRLLILMSIALFTICCTVRPKGVLSSRKMENVLYDLHRTDGILQSAGIYYRNQSDLSDYYLSVLSKYNITQAEFDSSLVWYTDNPQIFNKIYPRVVRRLEKERAELIAMQGERVAEAAKVFVLTDMDTLVVPALYGDFKPVELYSTTPQPQIPDSEYGFRSVEFLDDKFLRN